MSIQKLPKGLIDDMTKLMNGEELTKEDVDPKKERLRQKRAKINQEIEKAREQVKKIEAQEVQADKAGDEKRGAKLSFDRVDLYHKIGYLQDKLDDMKESKKLDPVGKADADIDNDGDTDSSDEYLKKRRAAIAKSMKDEEVDKDEDEKKKELVKEKGAKKDEKEVEEGKLPPALQKAIDKKKGKDTDDEKEVEETTHMSGKPEKKSIAQVRQDMQKSVKDANQKLKDAEARKKEKLKTATDMKEHLMPLIEEHGIELVSTVIHNLSLLDLDEAGPMGSVGIRQDFKQDSNKDARVAAWKKKQASMSGVERLQKKLEFARKQREVHDNAASEYREKAAKIRETNPDDRAADNYDNKADRQEEMGMDQNDKVRDIKDQIADMKGKK